MSVNILQQLSSIPNPGGSGVPVAQYVSEYQQALTDQLEGASQQQLSTLGTQQSALTKLQTALENFQQASYTLASYQQWSQVTPSSTNSSISVSASPGAGQGTYNVSVTSLAQNEVNVAQSGWQSSPTAAAGLSGTFTITGHSGSSTAYTTPSITVSSTDSLQTIVNDVNQYTGSTGVQASVIENSSNQYQLVMQSVDTGTGNAFTLNDSSDNLISTQLDIGSATQAASDAQITLDGVNLASNTNTFTQAIPDVTLNVSSAGASGTITLAPNTSAVVSSVQTWMSSYNSLVDLLHTDTAYTPANQQNNTPGSTGPLFGDVNANSLLAELPGSLAQQLGSGTFTSLAQLGIVLDPTNGHLEFQPASGFGTSGFSGSLPSGQTTFTNAISTNPSAVEQFFGVVQGSGSTAVPSSGLLYSLSTTLSSFVGPSGTMQTDINNVQNQQTSLNSYIKQLNSQIASQVQNFQSQLNQLNASLAQSQAQMQEFSALFGGSSTSAAATINGA